MSLMPEELIERYLLRAKSDYENKPHLQERVENIRDSYDLRGERDPERIKAMLSAYNNVLTTLNHLKQSPEHLRFEIHRKDSGALTNDMEGALVRAAEYAAGETIESLKVEVWAFCVACLITLEIATRSSLPAPGEDT